MVCGKSLAVLPCLCACKEIRFAYAGEEQYFAFGIVGCGSCNGSWRIFHPTGKSAGQLDMVVRFYSYRTCTLPTIYSYVRVGCPCLSWAMANEYEEQHRRYISTGRFCFGYWRLCA